MTRRMRRRRDHSGALLLLGAFAALFSATPAAAERGVPRISAPERQRVVVDDKGRGTLRARVVRRSAGRGRIVVRVRSVRGHARIGPRSVRVRPGRTFRVRVRLNATSRAMLLRDGLLDRRIRVVADPRRGPSGSRVIRVRFQLRRRVSQKDARGHGATAPPPGSRYQGIVPGLSEQGTAMFADPRFLAFGIPAARFVAPWDAIDTEPTRLDAWLGAAAAAGVEPLMVFNRARASRCPDDPCALPDVGAYEAAVRRFLARYPWVHVITPWNEPNHQAEPTRGDAAAAAAYYGAVRRACPACTIVAGDVLDSDNMLAWLSSYHAALPEEPAVWGLHNYHDTTHLLSDRLESFLGAVGGEVWLTETGGIVELRNSSGRVTHAYDEERAANGIRHAFALARAHAARVRRVYIYNWQDQPDGAFTSGLLDASGRERPGFFAFRDELALLISQPAVRR
jgi:Glycosyl hydrolase catalytic core